ncbi:MAG: hypothetical protein IPK80_04575 [Nannocystis sp.]|nr:hypothetical protein [Nannocystis sp.]
MAAKPAAKKPMKRPGAPSPLDLGGTSRIPPADRPKPPRPKSPILEALEEDYTEPAIDAPAALSADSARSVIDRIRQAAHFGDDSLDELPRLLAQIEGVKDPAILPELLNLFEDNDPYGIYWNILYVLENFPDEHYLGSLLAALPALYARAPVWAITCLLRVLNTRGDPDDCTLTFERIVKDASPDLLELVVEILRTMLSDPDEDLDDAQISSAELMLTSLSGARAAAAGATVAPARETAPAAAPESASDQGQGTDNS